MSHTPSLPESNSSIPVQGKGIRRFLCFTGPGLLVAVGYMDPGNWATDLAAGSKFGFELLSIIALSNLFAILLQYLSLKLGIASERDLAQACRDYYPKKVSRALWVLCEIAIAACDLAEVIGTAVALQLLFGVPIFFGVILTALDVFIVLAFQARGFRWIEAAIASLIFLIGGCFFYELFLSSPDVAGVLNGLIFKTDTIMNPEKLYLALGILGATVMPHNLYLHSSIVQTRNFNRTTQGKKEAIRFATLDSTFSLMIAFFINASILILSASVFNARGMFDVADIHEAYHLLEPLLGTSIASIAFGIALLASGQNSTITGTMAGQIVMEGFLDLRLRPWVRRLLTRSIAIIPAVFIAALYGESGIGKLLILSQVILSLQLPFAVIPLVQFTSSKKIMQGFENSKWLSIIAWIIAGFIVILNCILLIQTFQ
jgi:manganese transport protein